MTPRDEIGQLSFVKDRADPNEYPGCQPRDFFAVRPTGKWGVDNRIGAQCAREVIAFERRRQGYPSTIASMIIEMINRGAEYEGIAVGFGQEITDALARKA